MNQSLFALQEIVAKAFEESRDDVYYYALRLGLDAAEAQDTTQDAFFRLYTTLRSGEDVQNARAWVFRVVHNMAVNTVTRKRKVADLDENFVVSSPNPEESMMSSIRDSRLREAMQNLSPQQRQCLHLRAEGLRYREIAATLGITSSTANEFVRRAIARLRKVLA